MALSTICNSCALSAIGKPSSRVSALCKAAKRRGGAAGGSADSSGDYTLSGPEEKMTAANSAARTCARVSGMSICTTSKPATATWTKIDDCSE